MTENMMHLISDKTSGYILLPAVIVNVEHSHYYTTVDILS